MKKKKKKRKPHHPIVYKHCRPLLPRRPKPEKHTCFHSARCKTKARGGTRTHDLLTLKPRHKFNKLRWIQTQTLPCFRNIGQGTNNPTQQAHVPMFVSENRHSKQTHWPASTQEGIPISPRRFSVERGGCVSRPMHQMKDPQREDPPTHTF